MARFGPEKTQCAMDPFRRAKNQERHKDQKDEDFVEKIPNIIFFDIKIYSRLNFHTYHDHLIKANFFC